MSKRFYVEESNHPILLEVEWNGYEPEDRVVKRFIKKFKKQRIMDEIREHDHFVKPSEKKRKKRLESERKHRINQKKREEKNRDK